jgi:hypothetical protein
LYFQANDLTLLHKKHGSATWVITVLTVWF